jgi:hypothetical protein
MTIPDTPDNQRNNMMFNHTSDTQSNIATSFLDELDFSFYPPNNIMAQSIPPSMPIQQPQGMYSPNMFYPQQQQQQQFLLQQQPQQPQQQQQQQQQHYLPVFSSPQLVQHNQILLQRYNSNGSTTSSTNSQPSFLSNNYHSMGHFNVPMHAQQQGVYYQQQLQAELKKRQGTMNYGELLVEDHLLHQQAAGGSIMKKKPKTKKKKKVVDPNAPPKPKRKTGLNKPLILSPALSELMDGDKEVNITIYISLFYMTNKMISCRVQNWFKSYGSILKAMISKILLIDDLFFVMPSLKRYLIRIVLIVLV